MKNLAKLNGAKALSKNEQKSINGGVFGGILPTLCISGSRELCNTNSDCIPGEKCSYNEEGPRRCYCETELK